MKKTNYPATLLCDFYKISHREQYPEGTEVVYSTWTPRTSRIEDVNEVVAFGFQAFIKKYLIEYFNEHFFNRKEEDIVEEYKRYIKFTLGIESPNADHIIALHRLGYMPIKIKALPEGTLTPIRVPMLTIENTIPEFYWLTNYLETLMSTELWMATTSATIAFKYRKILEKYAKETGGDLGFVPFQGHDFSMRGMATLDSAKISGAGHLLSFVGTDTIPAIAFMEEFYNADIEKELVGTSISATEHSVMMSYGKNKEFETYKKLITETYPKGFLSIVSDTWDLWKVLTDIITPLKEDILARDGKIVVRPDSGDPVKIICGDINSFNLLENKGVIEILWDIFGGTINAKGYKELDPHIGAIYGDAITTERATKISEQLKAKGFSSTNIVYGIGSYTYQYNTRDTFGFALKSTYVKVNGKERLIFKDPITDDGTKKSQKGMVAVLKDKDDKLYCVDKLNQEKITKINNKGVNLLKEIFVDGKLTKETSLADIRERLQLNL